MPADDGPGIERVPPHLRRFIVEQDYAVYDAIDQAVWRFVLLQMYERLRDSAHPAYVKGLAQAGMSVDRIPRIGEMDACLRRFGWGAVCVDGFIPPRAFFELQAHGLLPIAADIRTVDHLAYTPAPDIIHEAAGHAPILPDAQYAAFLRRIGRVGARAFASPQDAEIYRAIYALSVVKERLDAASGEIDVAEERLAAALAARGPDSEAALLSRLYWWTVEYGLVGTPRDYKLYGAGLLSSLGESHFCHAPAVKKLPLTAECVAYDYDITRAQPQLFVARDFAQLGEVLDEVAAPFAQCRGGVHGLDVARQSGELASVTLDSGMFVVGVVDDVGRCGEGPAYVRFAGPVGVGQEERLLDGPRDESLVLPLGRLADGSGLMELTERELTARYLEQNGELRLAFRRGVRVEGRLCGVRANAQGRVGLLGLRAARVTESGRALALLPAMSLVAGVEVECVSAGSLDPSFHEVLGPAACRRAPEPRPGVGPHVGLLELYERAQRSVEHGVDVANTLERVDERLVCEHPDEWLLRWNLVESLLRLGLSPDLRARLVEALRELETRFHGRYPIASGLRYLGIEADGGSSPTLPSPLRSRR